MSDRADLIRAMFAAYRANDRGRVEEALADDFTFTTPFDDGIDKATYFARCWKTADWIERYRRFWDTSLDRLDAHLSAVQQKESQ